MLHCFGGLVLPLYTEGIFFQVLFFLFRVLSCFFFFSSLFFLASLAVCCLLWLFGFCGFLAAVGHLLGCGRFFLVPISYVMSPLVAFTSTLVR